MIGTIRAGLALFLMVTSGLLLAPFQYLAIRTGLFSATIIPRALAHARHLGAWLPRHRAWRNHQAAPADARVEPCFLVRHHHPLQPCRRLLHRQIGTRRLADLRHARPPAADDIRRAGAQADVGRAGERACQAAGGGRRDGAVCRGQHLRRQSDHAVQEHAVRRGRDGDPQWRSRQGLHPAGGHHLSRDTWHADGAAASPACRLDRRQRSACRIC